MRCGVPLRRPARALAATVGLTALAGGGLITPAQAAPSSPDRWSPSPSRACSPSTAIAGFSDSLDKLPAYGAKVGGLSNLAWDKRSRSLVATDDNFEQDPSRLWFFRGSSDPKLTRAPLVLRAPNGTPYTGATADNEGLAVSRTGDFIVSSEREPAIRVFGRDGVQRSALPVPSRFTVAPAGEATANATLEGLTLSPDKRRLTAAMEGTLSGDKPKNGAAANLRRFLVYTEHKRGWQLTKQVGYSVDDGMRIAEVQEYAPGKLLVLEASFDKATGNGARLYAVTRAGRAKDVSKVANLSTRPDLVLEKRLVADVSNCPTLGAKTKGAQRNPLLDNYEALLATPLRRHVYRVSLLSDDNFGATQTTRIVNLTARLP